MTLALVAELALFAACFGALGAMAYHVLRQRPRGAIVWGVASGAASTAGLVLHVLTKLN